MKFRFAIAALLMGAFSVFGSASYAAGTRITVATVGEPPTLDVQLSPIILVNEIAQHIFETLFAFDSHDQAHPLLAAAMPDISADGLTYRIRLRDDVKFHNGKAMTSDDVVASLERWAKINSKGKAAAEKIKRIAAAGEHEVVIELNERYAPLVALLSQYAVVMPKDTLDEPLTQFIGTGPFALKERKPDQYIDLVRFDGYEPVETEANGYAGRRLAKVDNLVFVPVPDANTRVEGLLSGQYDFADNLPISAYERLKSSDVAVPVVPANSGWVSLNFNTKEGVMSDVNMRRAVSSALNPADLLAAAFDKPEFYTVNASLFPKGSKWYSEEGIAYYGDSDLQAARELLKVAKYNDQPIRILTTRQYEFNFKIAQVAQAYLEAAGLKVELLVSDWATLTSRRADPAQWDIFITNSVFPADPSLHNTYTANYPGWYESAGKDKALSTYNAALTDVEQKAAAVELQKQFFQDMPLYKIGDFNALSGASIRLKNLQPAVWPFFWNVEVK